ncbi:MAG: DUF1616 domain-containing protein [Methanobacterium sp.]|jgi:uncharacterized membrane protein
MKRLYNADIIIVTLITLFCFIFLITSRLNDDYIGTTVEYLLVLFLPGYVIITIYFPKKNDLKNIKCLALSIILSISIAFLIGMIWNYVMFDNRLTLTLLSIAILTFLTIPVAFLKRNGVSKSFNNSWMGIFKSFKSWYNGKSQRDKVTSIILVIFVFIALSSTAHVVFSPKESERFTEFYLLGPGGKAVDYPTNLTTGETGKVIIGVVNHENQNTTYKMVVTSNKRIIDEQNLTLNNAEKFEMPYNFTVSDSGKKELKFLLYKLPDDKNAYRSLLLQIRVN